MSFLKTIIGANALALSMGLCLTVDANAQFFGNNQLGAVQQQTRANLDSQRMLVDNKITAALNAGQISIGTASSLRAQLATNRDMQLNAMADGFLSVAETQELINAMNSIDTNLASSTTVGVTNSYAATYSGFGGGYRTFNPNWVGRVGFSSDISARLNRLSNKIERGRANGRLNVFEYNQLRAEFDNLNSQRYLGGRRFNRMHRGAMLNAIASLESRVNLEMADREFATRGRYY